MSPHTKNLNELIAQVRSRIKARHVLRGAAITLAVFAVSLVLSAIAAGRLSHRPAALVILRFLPVALGVASACLFVAKPLRARLGDAQVARLIEEKCALGDRLATSVEFSESPRDASPAIMARLFTDTSERCSGVKADRVVDPRQAYVFGGVAAAILVALIATIFLGPSPVSTGMSALYSAGEAVSADAMFINVSPGTARAPRGSDQKIKASLSGFDSDLAQVFVRKQGSENWVAQVMEPGKAGGEFQHVIFNIQDSVAYYVESKGVRSPEFMLEVADLPFVKQIDLVLNFPAYTRLGSKKIENAGEIAALKGTVVHIIARMTGDPRSARIVVSDGTKVEMSRNDDELFVGQITVKQNGTYRIELTGEDGERYNGSNEYDITVLEDHLPSVVIDKPGRDMKVTSIQEIFAQVRAEDDYGVAGIELYYSVNGGDEKHVKLQDLKSDSPKTLSGAHTFFLEEFGLQPGDFISYYAKARDNNAADGGHESTSDIYFLEVRPFDREFRQAQQQGGEGGGDQESNALTRRQREIIAGTFRVQRELPGYTPQEKEENFGTVTLSQEKLKKDAEALAERIRRRLGDRINEQPDFAKLIEYVTQASKEMAGAIAELKSQKTREALAPEQRALQQLLRAEAVFREMQIAQGGGQGQGGQQDEKDLADLFELQLDKMKNQYETVQREQQAQAAQQQDDLARRLQELARRQQQQVEQRMRSQMQGGGGGGGSQRQQQEMIEEAEKMARELERLSRDRRDQKLQEAARQLQQSADEMRRSQAASSQSSSSQSSQSPSSSQANSEANAQAMRALERLEQARRMVESSGRAGAQQSVQQLRQQAEDALKRQDQIARGVEELARAGQNGQAAGSEEKKEQLGERKQALADQIAGLERDIDQTARAMSGDRQQAGDKLREAAGAIRNNRIPDRIRQNNQMIENGWYEQARERERTIRGNIEQVLKNIQAAEGGASRRSQGEGLEDALNRARELADNLESLRRRMESGDQGQSQQGQQSGQQRGGQQQNGRQQNGGQQGQAGRQNQGGERQGQPGEQQAQTGSRSQSQGSRGQQRGGQQAQGQQTQGGQRGQQGQQSGGQQAQQGQRDSGQQGQQPGGRQGQQSRGQQNQAGQQSQSGQQAAQGQQGRSEQGGQQASQAGGQAASETQQATTAAGGPPRGGQRQLESEIRERLGEAEELRKSLGRNSDLARDLNRVIEQLRRINPDAFSDPSQLAALKSEVIDPLRQLEVELARRLQAKLGNNGSGAFSDGDAPDRYRKMIEDYYRRLSARSPESKP
jgi:hypothetical protein